MFMRPTFRLRGAALFAASLSKRLLGEFLVLFLAFSQFLYRLSHLFKCPS